MLDVRTKFLNLFLNVWIYEPWIICGRRGIELNFLFEQLLELVEEQVLGALQNFEFLSLFWRQLPMGITLFERQKVQMQMLLLGRG